MIPGMLIWGSYKSGHDVHATPKRLTASWRSEATALGLDALGQLPSQSFNSSFSLMQRTRSRKSHRCGLQGGLQLLFITQDLASS